MYGGAIYGAIQYAGTFEDLDFVPVDPDAVSNVEEFCRIISSNCGD